MGLARTKTASIQNILLGDPAFCFAQFIAMRLSELRACDAGCTMYCLKFVAVCDYTATISIYI